MDAATVQVATALLSWSASAKDAGKNAEVDWGYAGTQGEM